MAHIKGLNEHRIVDNYAVLLVKRRSGEVLEGYVSIPTLEILIKLNWCWCASWKKNIKDYYLQHTEYLGTVEGKPQYKIHALHQLIMPKKDGLVPDHINHNGLDNRDENLRYLTNGENIKNSRRREANLLNVNKC
jgi:hypothetical protein